MQKIKKTHCVDPEKNTSETDGQTGRWTDEQDSFCRTPLQRWSFDHVFPEIREQIFLNYLV